MIHDNPGPMRISKPDNFVPETHFPADHPVKPGTPRCQSWNPNQGRQCELSPIRGKIRCKSHGGKTPSGLASPHHKTGLYSKSIPVRLLGEYESLLALGDDLFRLDDETATLTTLIQESLAKMETGESKEAWAKLQSLHFDMTEIGAKPASEKTPEDAQLFNAYFAEMGKIINYGNMAYAARGEVVALVESKRRLVSDERRDQANKHVAMNFDRVLLLLTAMANSFKQSLEKHLDDDKSRRVILSDTQTFLDRVISE